MRAGDGKKRGPAAQGLEPEERALGMGASITRRDFINSSLVGAGGALLAASAPLTFLSGCAGGPTGSAAPVKDTWYGYGGVGDYAPFPGNTREVMEAAHRIRDGIYNGERIAATPTGETYDLVVVGGGMSGLGAAHYFKKNAGAGQRCLVIENHGIFGGEAKRNEFLVDGERLVAPQGSNDFGVPAAGSGSLSDQIFSDLRIPREFEFQEWQSDRPPLRLALDNYAQMPGVAETQVDVGYFFGGTGGREDRWVLNMWQNDLAEAPFPDEVRQDLLRWRWSAAEASEAFRRRLDAMTYADFIEREMGLSPEVTRYALPVISLINGASPDAVSAFAASQIGMPGVARGRGRNPSLPLSFPGGNGAFARYLVKDLIPEGIRGDHRFDDILNQPVDFESLDQDGARIRMRLGATVVRVEHDGPPERAQFVTVIYEKDGQVFSVRARGVVMASGGWVNQHVVRDLPEDIREAYQHFHHAPALIANVALRNWRFMYDLGMTAAQWNDGPFGWSCNIRRPMLVGDLRQPLDPDRPTVLTFYIGLPTPGLSVQEQGVQGRWRLFGTEFAEYERLLREQMLRQFGRAGFDPERDIAGIVLNRWGHARLVQQPGFYFGQEGRPAPREVVSRGFGRIAIGHSELNGHQNWSGGLAQGYRAAEQALSHA